ncbi:hypothetical protein V8G54_018061 [Vigna mungo]|uniref:Uncharacterized protein n=1 Tax=Vigna mungo TaxID=3915 RepID=A0AAQ3N880_VIGMU
MHFKVAMHEPNTWIVCKKAHSNPASGWHTSSVPLSRVNQVELFGVLFGVKVSIALTHNEEVKAMKVKWVTLSSNDACILQNQLHPSVEWQHHCLSPTTHYDVVWWIASVVEFERRVSRKISGVNSLGLVEKMCLE